jgi:hypothetical protein
VYISLMLFYCFEIPPCFGDFGIFEGVGILDRLGDCDVQDSDLLSFVIIWISSDGALVWCF